jgi:hypothetical protein
MTCMPLIRRAYEADGGHISMKPVRAGLDRASRGRRSARTSSARRPRPRSSCTAAMLADRKASRPGDRQTRAKMAHADGAVKRAQ